MACKLKIWFVVSTMSLFANLQPLVCGEPQVPCLFFMGDSLVDNGNNNELVTTAKANYPPYGIDFPGGPTGRFTNGRNKADIIAELLGFVPHIPPFATARDQDILMGVNYGSGGAGILGETGSQLGDLISLDKQLLNHQTTVSQIALLLGSKEVAAKHLSKCIYYVGMGSNDYINNYFMPHYYHTSQRYTPERYATALIQQYSKQLKTLYKFGARKVAVFALGRIGCTPAEVAAYGTNGSTCVDKINNAAQLFDDKLKSLVDDLNNNLTDAKFIYVDATFANSSASPSVVGITVINTPCCVISSNLAKGQCAPNQIPCNNRSRYAFWDSFHPTESANVFLAAGAYSALTPLIPAA